MNRFPWKETSKWNPQSLGNQDSTIDRVNTDHVSSTICSEDITIEIQWNISASLSCKVTRRLTHNIESVSRKCRKARQARWLKYDKLLRSKINLIDGSRIWSEWFSLPCYCLFCSKNYTRCPRAWKNRENRWRNCPTDWQRKRKRTRNFVKSSDMLRRRWIICCKCFQICKRWLVWRSFSHEGLICNPG